MNCVSIVFILTLLLILNIILNSDIITKTSLIPFHAYLFIIYILKHDLPTLHDEQLISRYFRDHDDGQSRILFSQLPIVKIIPPREYLSSHLKSFIRKLHFLGQMVTVIKKKILIIMIILKVGLTIK